MSDDLLWLEEIEGSAALDWVSNQNKKTLDELKTHLNFPVYLEEIRQILNSNERTPEGIIQDSYVYNFWQNETHIRGVWRRTKIDDYLKESSKWEVLLDIDDLSKKENENWVFKGIEYNPDEGNLCLVSLSRGGKDAKVVREFDINKKTFVKDGFHLLEAKSHVIWLDSNSVIFSTDFGENSLTASGYPRILKIWRRGTLLKNAEKVFECERDDALAWSWRIYGSGGDYFLFCRQKSQYKAEFSIARGKNFQNLITLPVQEDVLLKGAFKDQLLLQLQSDWFFNGEVFCKGSLISLNLVDFFYSNELPDPVVIFSPNDEQCLLDVHTTKNLVLVTYLEQVKAQLLGFEFVKSAWKPKSMDFPKDGTISIISANPKSENFIVSYKDFLTPPRISLVRDIASKTQTIKSSPHYFDSSKMKVQQFFAKSKDGTSVPYFLVAKEALLKTKPQKFHKTLLYGYGGFLSALTPNYSAAVGKLWLEEDGIYVVANIRGGGEYGPRWHQGALLEKRQNAFDDFIAVAEDLIHKGFTDSKHLGIMGGSNGGLLVGTVFVQRPDLFRAVVCQVPLLDMLRYHKLLAGASWIGEYGDPDEPKMKKVLEAYSPYHNLDSEKSYPKVFFLTSTTDDRVHPGHARKMAAKMEKNNQEFYFYENRDGGHAAGANLNAVAQRIAFEYVYLTKLLENG